MGWVKVTEFNKYNVYQHIGEFEILNIIPSQFSNGIPFKNPNIISSTSNLSFAREGIYLNEVKKENEEDEIEEAEIKEVSTENTDGLCPCGSGKPYEKCCGR